MTRGEGHDTADSRNQDNDEFTVICPDNPPVLDSTAAKALLQLILRHAADHRGKANRLNRAQRVNLE
ncbi:hypothetical protein ACIBCN_06915 [Nocardia sp. NPDC051052]|uniref:hypothetical protein n=1 Tax=Nocardia sp. NPDC051052 TaxID=3364322 RepID=UPI0037907C53